MTSTASKCWDREYAIPTITMGLKSTDWPTVVVNRVLREMLSFMIHESLTPWFRSALPFVSKLKPSRRRCIYITCYIKTLLPNQPGS